jgi:hypothetical protein
MSLYAIDQRVWVKSQKSLGTVTEARYVTYGGKRKAEYVIDLDGHENWPNGGDWMCGSKDLRAADWCCEACGRYLPGQPFRSEIVYAYGEQDDRFDFCFLCVNLLEASKEDRDRAASDGYAWQTRNKEK